MKCCKQLENFWSIHYTFRASFPLMQTDIEKSSCFCKEQNRLVGSPSLSDAA